MLLVSFKSKSLRDFALYGKRHGINPAHAERIERCLAAIEKTQSVEELVRSKARQTHGMHGAFDGTYAVSVSGPSLRFDQATIAQDAQLIAQALQPVQHCM